MNPMDPNQCPNYQMRCIAQGIPCAWNPYPAQQGAPWGGMAQQQQQPQPSQQQIQAPGQAQCQNTGQGGIPTWGYFPGRGWKVAGSAVEAAFEGMEPAQYCWNAEKGWIINNYARP